MALETTLGDIFQFFYKNFTKQQLSKITSYDRTLVLLGPDYVGKTNLLYKLKLGEVVTTIPTIGFNVETIECTKRWTIWDIGGSLKIIPLWKHYLGYGKDVIYMINGSDISRKNQYFELFFTLIKYINEIVPESYLDQMKILILSNLFEPNLIKIDMSQFVEEIKSQTKFKGLIGSFECNVLSDSVKDLQSIFNFFLQGKKINNKKFN